MLLPQECTTKADWPFLQDYGIQNSDSTYICAVHKCSRRSKRLTGMDISQARSFIEYIITIAKNWALKGHPERYMYLSIAKMTMEITGYQPIHLNINT